MSFQHVMDARKRRILEAVTDDYIHTAEPVGSRTIARRYNLGVSPATIRNEMADLEESGYLEQPHTSSGRIPSEKGYRFYVDFIMKQRPVSEEERGRIRRALAEKRREINLIIEETARILAHLSRYAAFVLSPISKAGVFRRIEILPVDTRNVLVVLVTDPGFVRTHLIATGHPLTGAQLARIAEFLNSRLVNLPLSRIGTSLLREIKAELDEYNSFIDATMEAIAQSLEDNREEQVYADGQVNLLEQPEFQDVSKARTVLEFLAEEEALHGLLSGAVGATGVTVTIGREAGHPSMNSCSMVSAPYEVRGIPMGALGVVGPTRMHYSRVVALVEFVAENLGDVLTRILVM
ncbi:MAG: heat-inducible transcriptional repressor HrcA [Firmicutes bacterium]|jgi:heat-inducible transcriptional repressor|nr:heat-inducible transcriptional repressor HrcA [Bacillota bacterium]MDH7495006.1 heat-inducible transcriptional repressor HrcA [Bacillota bacterium]